MATHSSVLAWRIPGAGEPGGLTSMGSHRVGHNWSDLAAAARTLKHPNLAPQITMFPRGLSGGTVGVLSSWEVSCCSSLGSYTRYSIFKREFWKRLSWSIKIQILPPTPAPSFPKMKTACVLKSFVEEKIKREAWDPGFLPVKAEKDDRKGHGLQL